ncbi:MAG: hypothetical protein IJY80_06210, partial [Opitutales bacterium]|nr:hypothetical protein [Opitutales bacterium]
GTAFFKVAKLLPGSKITVKTRLGDVSVKGTTFYVSVKAASVSAGCIDGAIEVTPAGRGALTLTSARSVTISDAGALSFERVSSVLSNEAAAAFEGGEDDRVSSFGGSSSSVFDVTMPPAAVEGPNADRIPVNSASSLYSERFPKKGRGAKCVSPLFIFFYKKTTNMVENSCIV